MRTPEQKQNIINAFKTIGIDVKIKKARLDGWFLYHPYTMEQTRNIQIDRKTNGNTTTYRRTKFKYYADWLADDDSFDIMLDIAITEAKNRMNWRG